MIYIINRAFNKNKKLFRKDEKITEKVYNRLEECKIFVKRIAENQEDSDILNNVVSVQEQVSAKEDSTPNEVDEELEALKAEYLEATGKTEISKKFSSNKDWLLEKIEEAKNQ